MPNCSNRIPLNEGDIFADENITKGWVEHISNVLTVDSFTNEGFIMNLAQRFLHEEPTLAPSNSKM